MAALFRRSGPLCQCQRAFSTSSPRTVSLQWDKNDRDALAEVLPAYPYGPARWYKQSRLGLYGGQRIQFGNNVGEKIAVKTRRTWYPNIFTRKLFSKSLNRPVQVRVSARVLRTIDKLGGLDEYLLGEKEARIKELGESGWWLRWAIMQTPAVKKRFREERQALGITGGDGEAPSLAGVSAEVDTIAQGFEAFEASAEADQEGTSLEETEPMPMMDNAFQVEQSADLPVIKFRVGPGKHIMLTADGWRRTRPDPQRWIDVKKAKIQERIPDGFVESRVEMFRRKLDQHTSKNKISLTEDERESLIMSTKKKFRNELNDKVDAIYNRRQTGKEAAQAKRDAERKQRLQQKRPGSEYPPGLEI